MSDTRSVLITGAGRGLGYELCHLYLRMGWVVFPVVRSEGAAERFDATLPRRCHPVVADLASDDAIAAIRASVSAHVIGLDLLVNNAGIPGVGAQLASVTTREIGDLVNVHCLGVVRCTQAVLPLLQARRGSKIVNVTSRVGSFARAAAGEFADDSLSYAYRIAKAAQNMLTLCMSQELRPLGVMVCAVHPGEFRSGLNPEGDETPATVAKRFVDWLQDIGNGAAGRWHDPRVGTVPW